MRCAALRLAHGRLARHHPDQLNLALEDIEQTIAKPEANEEEAQAADTRRKRRINRGALPASAHSRDGRAGQHQLLVLQARCMSPVKSAASDSTRGSGAGC